MQFRLSDFGSPLTQDLFKRLQGGILSPGVYEGLDIEVVDSTTLRINPGFGVLPDGLGFAETESVELDFATPGSAQTFTVLAIHDDVSAVGGSLVVYQLYSGEAPLVGYPSAGSMALAYVHHPGAPTAINQKMIRPLPLRASDGLLNFADAFYQTVQLPPAVEFDSVRGANIVVTPTALSGALNALGARVQNTATSGSQLYEFSVPLAERTLRPRSVQVFGQLPASATLTLTARAADGTSVPVGSSSPTVTGPVALSVGDTAMVTASFAAQNSSAEIYSESSRKPMTLRLSLSLPAGSEAFLQRAVLTY